MCNKTLEVYFDISEHEKLDLVSAFIHAYQYSRSDPPLNPSEWGKIVLKDENLTLRFYGVGEIED